MQRPARRLEAEAIRDALLQIGGKLDEKMFGPSEENYESGRRSVYLRVKRSELIPFLTMFDAPEPAHKLVGAQNFRLDETLALYRSITAPLLAVEADGEDNRSIALEKNASDLLAEIIEL